MEIGDRCADIFSDPTTRPAHAGEECRNDARRHVERWCRADTWCRSHLAAALNEISRLQRGAHTAGERTLMDLPPRHLEDVGPDPRANPPTERKAYAPDPVGKPPERKDPTPPDPPVEVRIPVWIPISTLGTLLDILA
ncbi:MAG: hypothetical protein ACYSU7_12220 [Planctomycetota bacterium]|jgi:hypothetical protein